MQIHVIKSKFYRGIFEQNTYVLENKNDVILIDAGADVGDIKSIVKGKRVLAILITHIHFDHVWFIEEYLNEFPDADVYVVAGEEKRFEDGLLNASFLINSEFQKNVSKNRIKYYAKNLKIGSFDFEVYFTPGHSDDGVCLLTNRSLFTGDTLFFDSIGRTDFKGGDSKKMEESLRLIAGLDFDYFYPGHYESGTKNDAIRNIHRYV